MTTSFLLSIDGTHYWPRSLKSRHREATLPI